MRCAVCESDNPAGQRFCGECGSPLAVSCSVCGAANPGGQRFCGDCGSPLSGTAPPRPVPGVPAAQTERRVCSVLFCDLVGFTPLSEARDPEDVRELLSRYFDATRTVIERYGGVVEKFIGDAVMAVWGTPVAAEGDAERAVRAALEVVATVAQQGAEVGAPGLAARAGVVTDEVAVNLAAHGEGMVAGDAVNTAARVQATAEPGQVLVDEATFRLSRSAVTFASAGEHTLKGKTEGVQLWRAERVVSNVGGGQRVDGLESPLVGRDAELRLIKELFHAAVDRRTPRLVSVTGIAGVGKSRLGWEFEKYIDGLAIVVNWHRGRCLAYGSGVAFWALAEMVRQRLGIAEEDPVDVATARLTARLGELVPDAASREFIAPRLARLLGVERSDAAPMEQADLFAGWRLFFEQLAADGPVVMVVEDLHRADDGLLDFLGHLIDWARSSPIFVLSFGRSELVESRPHWGTGRGGTTLALEPLDDAAMTAMLDRLVADLPESAAKAIAEQAEGIPLYAIETVRMLVDRDVIRPVEGVYRLVADLGELRVPDSLQSLLAARLDSLPTDVRALVADAAVLGSTFPVEALVSLSGRPSGQVRAMLTDLVRREVFSVRADPLSPERGQFGFVQTMLRQVAYDTLSRRERKARHLAVAEHLASAFSGGGEDITEIVAGHLLDALEAVPADVDEAKLRDRAAAALETAGERAVRTGAPAAAARSFLRAANVLEASGDDDGLLGAARLRERTGHQLQISGDGREAAAQLRAAEALFRRLGHERRAIVAGVAAIEALDTRRVAPEEVPVMLAELRAAVDALGDEPDSDSVDAIRVLARSETMLGNAVEAEALYRKGLVLAQELDLGDRTMADLLLPYGIGMIFLVRPVEGAALLREALRRAQSTSDALLCARIQGNLSELLMHSDTEEAVTAAREAVTVYRRLGGREMVGFSYANLVSALHLMGRWDEADAALRAAADAGCEEPYLSFHAMVLATARGEFDRVGELFDAVEPAVSDSSDVQDMAAIAAARAMNAFSSGELRQSLQHSVSALSHVERLGMSTEPVRWAWSTGVEAALRLGDVAEVDRLLAWLADKPRGHIPPVLRAAWARGLAERAALADAADADLDARAVDAARGSGLPYQLALALVNQAEHLTAASDADAAAMVASEAREIAERLRTKPLQRRLDALDAPARAPASR